jgi:hypothetical protein
MPRAHAALAALVSAALAAPACDGGLAPVAAPTACPPGFTGICGTITIRGAVPESTDVVYLVAYRTFPTSTTQLFSFVPSVPPTLPLGGTEAFYTLPVPAGRYEWVLAVWKKVGTLSPGNADSLLMEAGFYRDPADTTRPGVVVVSGAADSIDFVVDFDNRHSISYWFPAAAP